MSSSPAIVRVLCRLAVWLTWLAEAGSGRAENPPPPALGDLSGNKPADDGKMMSIAEAVQRTGANERVKVSGVVVFQTAPGYFNLKDDTGGIRVLLRQSVPVRPGDRVEVTGIPSFYQMSPAARAAEVPGVVILDALVTVTGRTALPAGIPMRASEAYASTENEQKWNGEFVTVHGTVLWHGDYTTNYTLAGGNFVFRVDVVGIDDAGTKLHVFFNPALKAKEHFPVGALGEFTGVCRLGPSREIEVAVPGMDCARVIASQPYWQRPDVQSAVRVATIAASVIAALAIVWLISHRRRVQLLRAANSELEERVAARTRELDLALSKERELGEMKTNFVSLVSHEFRTPLGVIMAAVEVLRRYFDKLDDARRAEHLDIIFRSTRNLAGLIDEVLLLGRMDDGRLSLTPEPVDLDKFCRSLADEMFSATGGACEIDYRALTPLDGARLDEPALRHILANLLSNAVKYSDPGRSVEFTVSRDAGMAVLTVRDLGIGIPEDDQARLFPHVFQRQQRGQPARHRARPCHRATLRATARRHHRFAKHTRGRNDSHRQTAGFPANRHHRLIQRVKTILVIEDQPDMLTTISTILEMEGHAVLAANNGKTGLTLAQEEKPDLILCDVMMPGMDGHAVLHALRKDRTICGTPFIFLTARGERQDLRAGMDLGADDYLTKPVSVPELLGAINARLARENQRNAGFDPDFSSAAPLAALGLTPREAEVLLWVAQGKSNPEIAGILGAALNTIKVHLGNVFNKLGADNRHAAMLIALEKLGKR